MKRIFSLLAITGTVLLFSCKKTSVDEISQPSPSGNPLVSPAGTASGAVSSKLINAAAGGTVTSTDGRITVNIPANALAANTTIGIQPISNTTGVEMGRTYRLTPHGTKFNVPVTISFNYADAELTGAAPEVMTIAYQDDAGAWKAMNNTVLNKPAKKLSVTTKHFSDWGYFPLVYIQPGEARVGLNESVDLKVMYLLSQEDWELVALPDESPLTHPGELLSSFIKGWIFNGKGSLSPAGSGAVYKAPSSVPAQNPEAVNAEINFRKKGIYLLVANITVLGEFHIDYLDVDETEVNLPQVSHGSRLFIYGNFGNDPGAANRAVKINNVDVSVMTWTPKIIICEIAAIGPASSGEVTVSSAGKSTSKLLNDWIVELNYAKKESPDGALTRKTNFLMRFRGDAIGYGSGGQAPLLPYTDLNKTSRAIIDMPAGSFSNSVTVSTCGTYTVKWDAISGHVTDRTLYSTGTGFRGRVYKTATGFGVKIKSIIESPLKSTRIFAPCIGSSTQQIVNEPISFEGYHEETIWFNFATQTARTTIKAGAPPMLIGTGVAPGLFWDVQDVNMSLFTTKISWAEAIPKFN